MFTLVFNFFRKTPSYFTSFVKRYVTLYQLNIVWLLKGKEIFLGPSVLFSVRASDLEGDVFATTRLALAEMAVAEIALSYSCRRNASALHL